MVSNFHMVKSCSMVLLLTWTCLSNFRVTDYREGGHFVSKYAAALRDSPSSPILSGHCRAAHYSQFYECAHGWMDGMSVRSLTFPNGDFRY